MLQVGSRSGFRLESLLSRFTGELTEKDHFNGHHPV
jgi:hypothetical protein